MSLANAGQGTSANSPERTAHRIHVLTMAPPTPSLESRGVFAMVDGAEKESAPPTFTCAKESSPPTRRRHQPGLRYMIDHRVTSSEPRVLPGHPLFDRKP